MWNVIKVTLMVIGAITVARVAVDAAEHGKRQAILELRRKSFMERQAMEDAAAATNRATSPNQH